MSPWAEPGCSHQPGDRRLGYRRNGYLRPCLDGFFGGLVIDGEGLVCFRLTCTKVSQSFDLIDVEDRVKPEHEEPVVFFIAVLVLHLLDHGAPEHDLSAPLARWNVIGAGHYSSAEALPLLERCPPLRREAVLLRGKVQKD